MTPEISRLIDSLVGKLSRNLVNTLHERYDDIVEGYGPEPYNYPLITNLVQHLYEQGEAKTFEKLFVIPYREQYAVDPVGMISQPLKLMLHIFDTPYGYNGDATLLDYMYMIQANKCRLRDLETIYSLDNWDRYISAVPEMQAVHNRKVMFTGLVKELMMEEERYKHAKSNTNTMELTESTPLRILDIGCGNGMYLQIVEDIAHDMSIPVELYGIDADPLATGLAKAAVPNATIVTGNAYRVLAKDSQHPLQFDFVFSLGLFDYFSDRMFTEMLKLISYRKPIHTLIGNMHQTPATRAMMRILGWEIVDRTPQDLLKLGRPFKSSSSTSGVGSDFTNCQHLLLIANERDHI